MWRLIGPPLKGNERKTDTMLKTVFSKTLVMAAFAVGLMVTAEAAPAQKICPLMIEDEIDEEEFVVYKGVKVYTCCGTCKKMWAQNPDYYAVVSIPQAPQLKAVASKDIKAMKRGRLNETVMIPNVTELPVIVKYPLDSKMEAQRASVLKNHEYNKKFKNMEEMLRVYHRNL